MANLNQFIGSVVSLLAVLMLASVEVSCGGKGKGSDIILYKNNLLIRDGKGKGGTLLIAGGHHGHHDHGGHGGGHGGGHHGGHHEGHHEEHRPMIMMGVKGKGKGKGKGGYGMGGYGMGGYGMGGKGKGKGKGGMDWEQMIMGGGKY